MTTTYKLTHRIFIQTSADTTDTNGNTVQVWTSTPINPIWAEKRGLSGRTFFAAAAVNAEDNILFTAHYTDDTKAITKDMRIVEGVTVSEGITTYAHIYEITAPPVDVEDAHRWIEIRVRELV